MERNTLGTEPLPETIDELEQRGPLPTTELWLMARSYSRLRHRTSPRRQPRERTRYEALKLHCVCRAIGSEPDVFLVFNDPGFPHLVIVYHRTERTLLHVPLANWIESQARLVRDKESCAV